MYATLLVLEEYEKTELYEECAIIRDALTDYKNNYRNQFPKEIKFPMHASEYRSKSCQDMLEKHNLTIEDKVAKEKATLIKLNLPLTDEYR